MSESKNPVKIRQNDLIGKINHADVRNDLTDEEKSIEHENNRIVHTFAHCMWWVDQGDDLPKDEKQRNTQWSNESSLWIRKAQHIILHLNQNKLIIANK